MFGADSVRVTWDASTSAGVAAYRIHYGPNAAALSYVTNVGLVRTQTVAVPLQPVGGPPYGNFNASWGAWAYPGKEGIYPDKAGSHLPEQGLRGLHGGDVFVGGVFDQSLEELLRLLHAPVAAVQGGEVKEGAGFVGGDDI